MRKNFICIICSFLITVSAFATSSMIYGPTTADDTLWHIANELKPNNEVSIEQVMLALFCHNEDAFSSSNINALKPGKIIKLPSIDGINSIPKDQAYLEVEKQNRQWKKAYLKRPIKHHKPAKVLKPKKTKNTNLGQSRQPSSAATLSEPLQQQPVVEIPPVQAIQQPLVAIMPQPPTPSAQEIAEAINAKNSIVQAQVIQLNERISSLEQNVAQLKKYILESQKTFWDNLKPIQQYIAELATHGQPLFTILFVCVVVLLLLILFYLLLRRRKSSVEANTPHHDVVFAKEEYDLMESKEGIAAKLNLARAYIDMGKGTEARIMLDEALANGSSSEQAEAKELLAKIKEF
ncbi:pilus assembly protein FimV [Gammaproteobacteria bacterium]